MLKFDNHELELFLIKSIGGDNTEITLDSFKNTTENSLFEINVIEEKSSREDTLNKILLKFALKFKSTCRNLI